MANYTTTAMKGGVNKGGRVIGEQKARDSPLPAVASSVQITDHKGLVSLLKENGIKDDIVQQFVDEKITPDFFVKEFNDILDMFEITNKMQIKKLQFIAGKLNSTPPSLTRTIIGMDGGTNDGGLVAGVVLDIPKDDVPKKKSKTEKDTHDDKKNPYKMDAVPRGVCCIFCNKNFDGKPNKKRVGSDNDRDGIAEVFQNLGFTVVKPKEDLSAGDMLKELENLSKTNHDPYDCLVVIFLTHGEDGAIEGSDNNWIYLDKISALFKSDQCPSLLNKPKLFFFQSCRGSTFQKGHEVKADGVDDDVEWTAREVTQMAAPEADFFFGYATVAGKMSVRNVEHGSWYIQELIKVFKEQADTEDLLSMMTAVKQRVNDHKAEHSKEGFIKQTAEMTSSLLKKVYFR